MRIVVVEKGDTLWRIAAKNGVSLEELLKANPQIRDPNKIFPGDKVFIPEVKDGHDDAPEWEVGTIAKEKPQRPAVNRGAVAVAAAGDTLTTIGRRFQVDRDILAAVNGELGGERLRDGVEIYLPGFHHRQQGESLYAIAALYDVGLEALLAANPAIDDSEDLDGVEKLAIPRRENGDIGVYVVKSGDSLYRIAGKYNIPPAAILAVNSDLGDGERIYPGQVLRIPGPYILRSPGTLAAVADLYGRDVAEVRELNPALGDGELPVGTVVRLPRRKLGCFRGDDGGVSYCVRQGDTAEAVAAMYRLPLSALIGANPGLQAGPLRAGRIIHVPTGFVEQVGYDIRRGDTLAAIARRYGVTVSDLQRANPEVEAENLPVGGCLRIPIRDALWQQETATGGDVDEPAPEWEASADTPADHREATAAWAEPPEWAEQDDAVPEWAVSDAGGSETTSWRSRQSAGPELYVAAAGDTPRSVAARFGVDVAQLYRANAALGVSEELVEGQVLVILN